jgi:predicted ATPase
MITRLRLRNFKSFVDSGDLLVRPLTLIVGPNSSGKTSLLQSLLLLRQTVDSRDIENPLLIDGEWASLGSYLDLVYAHDKKRNIQIEVDFLHPFPWLPSGFLKELGVQPSARAKETRVRLETAFGYYPYLKQVYLDATRFELGEEQLVARIRRVTRYKYAAELVLPDGELASADIQSPYKFYGVTGMKRRTALKREREFDYSFHTLFRGLSLAVEETFQRVFFVGPLRDYPRRVYLASGAAPQDVGLRGENAIPVLWFEAQRRRTRTPLLAEVRRWMKEFEVALEVQIEAIRGSHFALTFVDPQSRLTVSIADVGFGASQVLPIVVAGYFAEPGATLLIEQPEIHLHPRAQATLGDLLIAIAGQKKSLLVETHSEHLIARIRTRIAQRRFDPNDLAIYYCESTPNGTAIRPIAVNGFGQFEPESLPPGFFAEDYQESLQLMKAIADRG